MLKFLLRVVKVHNNTTWSFVAAVLPEGVKKNASGNFFVKPRKWIEDMSLIVSVIVSVNMSSCISFVCKSDSLKLVSLEKLLF